MPRSTAVCAASCCDYGHDYVNCYDYYTDNDYCCGTCGACGDYNDGGGGNNDCAGCEGRIEQLEEGTDLATVGFEGGGEVAVCTVDLEPFVPEEGDLAKVIKGII